MNDRDEYQCPECGATLPNRGDEVVGEQIRVSRALARLERRLRRILLKEENLMKQMDKSHPPSKHDS